MVDGSEMVGYVAVPKSQNEVGSSHGAPSSMPVVVDTLDARVVRVNMGLLVPGRGNAPPCTPVVVDTEAVILELRVASAPPVEADTAVVDAIVVRVDKGLLGTPLLLGSPLPGGGNAGGDGSDAPL